MMTVNRIIGAGLIALALELAAYLGFRWERYQRRQWYSENGQWHTFEGAGPGMRFRGRSWIPNSDLMKLAAYTAVASADYEVSRSGSEPDFYEHTWTLPA